MKHRYHFARQRRQLLYLAKRLVRLRAAGRRLPDRLTDKFHRLVRQLAPRIGTRELRRALGTSALLLGLSFTASAQIDLDFAPPVLNPFGLDGPRFAEASYNGLTFADLDDDGDLDLLTSLYTGALGDGTDLAWAYQENVGTAEAPQFAPVRVNPFGLSYLTEASSVALVDLDGDGDLDLLESGYLYEEDGDDNGSALVFRRNIGSATVPEFAAPEVNPFGIPIIPDDYNVEFAIGDLDGDGDADLLIQSIPYEADSEEDPGRLRYYKNTSPADGSTIEFTASEGTAPFGLFLEAGDQGFALVDLDDDGDLDMLARNLVSIDETEEDFLTQSIFVIENVGSAEMAAFADPQVVESIDQTIGTYLIRSAVADLDGDGDIDLLSTAYGQGVRFYENTEIVSVRDAVVELDLTLAPNPTAGLTHVSTTETLDYVTVIDGRGRELRRLDGSARRIDLSTLPAGLYSLRFVRPDGRYGVRRVVRR